MSNDVPTREPAAPVERVSSTPPSAPVSSSRQKPPAASRGPSSGALALALLLSLVAVGAAGYVAWQQWQLGQGDAANSGRLSDLASRVGTMEGTLGTLDDERRALRDRLRDADDVNRGMREELLGQNERLRNLEDAVARLSEKSLSGHDAMLLDETESLLRMGKERYVLFHDAAGAASAYALADQTLAAVNDGAFSGLRQSVSAEHDALSDRASAQPDAALRQIQQLRSDVGAWPLRPLDAPAGGTSAGVWPRVRDALVNVVRIERDDGAPLAVADARLARELLALDLAGAEAALLAHDPEDAAAALKRADAGLATQFDASSPAVRDARGTLAKLQAGMVSSAPLQLGAALAELRNLRAVHALKPAESGAAPAPARAGSTGTQP